MVISFPHLYLTKLGSHKDRLGIRTITAKRNKSAIQKGVTPLKILEVVTSGKTPRKTKTFRPTGGVIKLISVITTTKIPNQIGSNPSSLTKGKNIGTVNNIIDKLSKTHPKHTYVIKIARMTS